MSGTIGRGGGNRRIPKVDPTPVDGGPVCPEDLPANVKRKWHELVEQVPVGVLRKIDGHQLTILSELLVGCDALARLIHDNPLDDKSRRLFLQSADRINRLSSQFGLSPSDRRRLNLQAEDASEDPFLAYLSGD